MENLFKPKPRYFQLITDREQQVLHLVAFEKTTKEIANELFISQQTVISHRKNIMLKLDVKNTAGMVRVGFENGLLNTFK